MIRILGYLSVGLAAVSVGLVTYGHLSERPPLQFVGWTVAALTIFVVMGWVYYSISDGRAIGEDAIRTAFQSAPVPVALLLVVGVLAIVYAC